MIVKSHIRQALELSAVFVAGILVGMIAMGTLPIQIEPGKEPKAVVPLNAVALNKEMTQAIPVPAESQLDEYSNGVGAPVDTTAPAGSTSETQNMTTPAAGETYPHTVTGQSPEQLVYHAENTFAGDLTSAEKLAALRSLENIDDPMVVDPVMIAMDDPDPDLRKAALEVLRDREYEEVNEVFIAGLEDENQDVTDRAMEILADGDSANILPSLEQAMMSSDGQIKRKAIVTLEDIEDVRAIDMLIAGLQSNDEDIRGELFDSIEFVTEQRFESYEEARNWWDLNRDFFDFD